MIRKFVKRSCLVSVCIIVGGAQAATDVDLSTPGNTLSALWNAISHQPGEVSDLSALQQILHPTARIMGVSNKDGKGVVSVSGKQDFIESLKEPREKGFFECEVWRDLDQYERMAAAYSVVESRYVQEQVAADFTGVNSIQLFKQDDNWQVLSVYFELETPDTELKTSGPKHKHCLNQ